MAEPGSSFCLAHLGDRQQREAFDLIVRRHRKLSLMRCEIDPGVVVRALTTERVETIRVNNAVLVALQLTPAVLSRERDDRSDPVDTLISREALQGVYDEADVEAVLEVLDSQFAGHTQLTELEFGDRVDIVRCRFDDRLDVSRCRFDADATISGTFTGRCSIVDTTASGRVALGGEFANELIVQQCSFESTLDLTSGATPASGRQTFARSKFGDDVMLASGDVEFIRPGFGEDLVIDAGDAAVTFSKMTLRHPIQVRSAGTGAMLCGIIDSVLIQPMAIDDSIDATGCSFRGTSGLDQLVFRSEPRWPRTGGVTIRGRRFGGRSTIADESAGLADVELEPIYRQLRRSLEASKAYSAASDFFYGEMEARRRQRSPSSADWWLLSAYRLFGGYGVRSSRPLIWLIGLLTLVTVAFELLADGLFDPDPADDTVDPNPNAAYRQWGSVAAFVARNSFALFRATTDGLAWPGVFLVLFTRLVAVVLLGLAALGLRSRTRR